MKKYFYRFSPAWILLGVLPLAGSTTSRIYVMNHDDSTVNVIDPTTNRIVQTIEGIPTPYGATFSPDGSRAYITSVDEHFLSVVDTKTGKIIKKVLLSDHGDLPAITKDGSRVFVCIRGVKGAVDIVDTSSLEKVKSLPMKARMHECYTTPDGKYVVAGSREGKFVVAIDTQTEQVAWEIPFDRGPLNMAFERGPDGSTRRIFVVLVGFHGFAVVDFAKREEVARINLPGQPSGFKITDVDSTHGDAVAPDGKTLWVCSILANAVFVYSLPDLKLLGHIAMPELKAPTAGLLGQGAHPDWLTFTPDGNTAYVCNSDTNSVSAVDVKTRKEVARIPVGKQPKRCTTLLVP